MITDTAPAVSALTGARVSTAKEWWLLSKLLQGGQINNYFIYGFYSEGP